MQESVLSKEEIEASLIKIPTRAYVRVPSNLSKFIFHVIHC